MTTHDQYTAQPTDRPDPAAQDGRQPVVEPPPPPTTTEPPAVQDDPLRSERSATEAVPEQLVADQPVDDGGQAWTEPASGPSAHAESDAAAAPASPSEDRSLFAGADLAGLRARWDDVQAGFVDDPKACVQKADGLVSDVVDQLVNSFSAARTGLEERWARGEEASTEDLRIALKRYREFFERLLSV